MKRPRKSSLNPFGDYLEVMSKAVFQSGMSWRVVEAKWPGIRSALREFDAYDVADMRDEDVDALVQDTRVIRNRRKLDAIVGNANRLVQLEREHGAFQDYLRSHADFDATVKALRKDFKFLGEMGCYYFLYVVGEQVPSYEEWCASRGR